MTFSSFVIDLEVILVVPGRVGEEVEADVEVELPDVGEDLVAVDLDLRLLVLLDLVGKLSFHSL